MSRSSSAGLNVKVPFNAKLFPPLVIFAVYPATTSDSNPVTPPSPSKNLAISEASASFNVNASDVASPIVRVSVEPSSANSPNAAISDTAAL